MPLPLSATHSRLEAQGSLDYHTQTILATRTHSHDRGLFFSLHNRSLCALLFLFNSAYMNGFNHHAHRLHAYVHLYLTIYLQSHGNRATRAHHVKTGSIAVEKHTRLEFETNFWSLFILVCPEPWKTRDGRLGLYVTFYDFSLCLRHEDVRWRWSVATLPNICMYRLVSLNIKY